VLPCVVLSPDTSAVDARITDPPILYMGLVDEAPIVVGVEVPD